MLLLKKYYVKIGNKNIVLLASNPFKAACFAYFKLFSHLITPREAEKTYKYNIGVFFRVSEQGFTERDTDVLVSTLLVINYFMGIESEGNTSYENR